MFDSLGTGAGVSQVFPVPNRTALTGGSTALLGAKVRCVGMGFALTYGGTETLRSATITVGTVTNGRNPTVVAVNGTNDQFQSMIGAGQAAGLSVSDFKDAMTESTTFRVPSSGVVTGIWKPAGVPSYQLLNQANQQATTGRVAGTSASATATGVSGFNMPEGGAGLEENSAILAILIEGDSTSSSTAQGNVYNIKMKWIWELIPDQPRAITNDVTFSPARSEWIDDAFNRLAKIPIAQLGNFRRGPSYS